MKWLKPPPWWVVNTANCIVLGVGGGLTVVCLIRGDAALAVVNSFWTGALAMMLFDSGWMRRIIREMSVSATTGLTDEQKAVIERDAYEVLEQVRQRGVREGLIEDQGPLVVRH